MKMEKVNDIPMYQTPSGTFTSDKEEYMQAWHRLMLPFAQLTQSDPVGFDPTCQFSFKGMEYDVPVGVVQRVVLLLNKHVAIQAEIQKIQAKMDAESAATTDFATELQSG